MHCYHCRRQLDGLGVTITNAGRSVGVGHPRCCDRYRLMVASMPNGLDVMVKLLQLIIALVALVNPLGAIAPALILTAAMALTYRAVWASSEQYP